jgi:RNA polymerase sigma-70 factor (ECF subfamily)
MTMVADRHMSPELAETFEREAIPHRAVLLRSALRLTRNLHDAEDLVQETMTRACAGFARFEPGTNARAWLHRVMVNAFINEYRKRQREPTMVPVPEEQLQMALSPQLSAATSSAEEQVLAHLPAQELVAALRGLPEEFRQVVCLVDVEGHSYREAAAIMGCPVGTVMSRLHRSRSNPATRCS